MLRDRKWAKVVLLWCTVVAVAPGGASGAPQWLSDRQIAEIFTNATIEGAYASGRSFRETYRRDGRVEYSDNGAAMGGSWSATAGTLCTIYDGDPTGGCFRVTQTGINCFEFYFATRTAAELPLSDDERAAWTARGSIESKPGKCGEDVSV